MRSFQTVCLLLFCLLLQINQLSAQPDNGKPFGYGMNLGYYAPDYVDLPLAELAHDLGSSTIRVGGYHHFFDFFGFAVRLPQFEAYEQMGLTDIEVICGYPAPWAKAPHSNSFLNLYEPIRLGDGAVNPNNYFAFYMDQLSSTYAGLIGTYQIWNEPDVDLCGCGWAPASEPVNWWTQDPAADQFVLGSDIYSYIRMLRIAREVVKQNDPQAKIAVGGLGWPSFWDAILRNTDNPSNGDLTDKYNLKGADLVDVLDIHYYPHFNGVRQWSNAIGGFEYHRNSDALADATLLYVDKFQGVSMERTGNRFPVRISETNVPRKQFQDFVGSDEAQANYIAKLLVLAQMRPDIQAIDFYALGDEQAMSTNSQNEFAYMGLVQNLTGITPPDYVPNLAAQAYGTVSKTLLGKHFDPTKTNAMGLPANIRGGCFTDGVTDEYVLWAVTTGDQTEVATATYDFAAINLQSLVQRNWDWSATGITTVINSTVVLDGAPKYFTPNGITGTTELKVEYSLSPNPTEGTSVYCSDQEKGDVLEAYDLTGRIIWSAPLQDRCQSVCLDQSGNYVLVQRREGKVIVTSKLFVFK